MEEEKFETTFSEILERQKKEKKKRIIKKQKTKKIVVNNSINVQTTISQKKVEINFGEKIIKDFKTSEQYAKVINYKPGVIISSSSELNFEDISQIKRKNFALGVDGSTIFVHGGENEKKSNIYKNLTLNSKNWMI